MKFSDPIINSLIKKYPPPTFSDRTAFLFEDLIESVISQQLSVKASDTIYKRFKDLFTIKPIAGVTGVGDPEGMSQTHSFPTPQQILETEDQDIRDCGISFQKISYIKSIADAFLSDLIDVEKIKKMTDEEIIAHLTQIRGVGNWTAEMILIFTLNRPDVFSVGDLGIRNAIKNLYGITEKEEMLQLSEKWRPYRSTACWYLWRSLENS